MINFLNKKLSLSARKAASMSAYTLIEMIVSISVITMITALFIVNYRSAEKRTDIIMAAQALVADLHLAQNNALGLVKYNQIVPAGGWGVNFKAGENTYMLFADLEAPGGSGYLDYNEGEGEIAYGARLTKLPPGITIEELRIGGTTSEGEVNVSFLPPDPQTNIYDGVATSTSLEIELKEARNNSIKTIRVNFLGLIEVLD
jgi:type II secretory pathway pseudopilin PulG